ncbi:MAG: hypothetical protein AAGB31_15050 [Bdellovibrio sp.]
MQLSRTKWLPSSLRDLMPEFLDYIVSLVAANKPFLPLLDVTTASKRDFYLYAPEVGGSSILIASDLMKMSPSSQIVVLSENLSTERAEHFRQTILDFPPQVQFKSFSDLKKREGDSEPEKVLISINHAHLLSDQELLLRISEMMAKFDQIIIGEGNNKSARQVIGMLLLSPLVAFFCGPLVKPLKTSRLFFTYLLPLLPIMIAWDGIVALFKIRSPERLKELIEDIPTPGWTWQTGKLPNNRGGFIIYLKGIKPFYTHHNPEKAIT